MTNRINKDALKKIKSLLRVPRFRQKIRPKIQKKPYKVLGKSFIIQRSNVSLIIKTLSWGGLCMGWTCTESGLAKELIRNIWSWFESPNKNFIRDRLSLYKDMRSRIFKLLGSKRSDQRIMMEKPPVGWLPIYNTVLKRLEVGTIAEKRLLTTILYSTRLLKLPKKVNLSSIITDSLYTNECIPPNQDFVVGRFWRALRCEKGRTSLRRLSWTEWHLTTKVGPNGHAMRNLMRDCMTLPDKLIDDLGIVGGSKVRDNILRLKNEFSVMAQGSGIDMQPGILRKLSTFPDIEGKTRIVGILDYFSQSVLKKLHSFLFKILRKIPQDFTFNQGGFTDKIKDWTEFYSCDLKDATDRVPIILIEKVLKGLLPDDYVQSWKSIMIDYPFLCKIKGEGDQFISYKTGNPMGAYSSWASFAITHHFIIFECCYELKIPFYKAKYCLLGDDILIGDHNLYARYREKLKLYRVEVSEAKTHESEILCEFAKRWIYKGQEISPYPLPALREAGKKFMNLVPLVVEEEKRGHLLECGIPEAVSMWIRICCSDVENKRFRREKFYKAQSKKSQVVYDIIRYFRGKCSASQLVYSAMQVPTNEYENRSLLEKDALVVIKTSIDSMLRSSMLSYNDRTRPYKGDWESKKEYDLDILPKLDALLAKRTGADFDYRKGLSDITPWSHVVRRAFNQYFQLQTIMRMDVNKVFNKFQLIFPLLIRAVVIPHPCKIFIGRKYDMINMFNSGLSAELTRVTSSPLPIKLGDPMFPWDLTNWDWKKELKDGKPEEINNWNPNQGSYREALKKYEKHPIFSQGKNMNSAWDVILKEFSLI